MTFDPYAHDRHSWIAHALIAANVAVVGACFGAAVAVGAATGVAGYFAHREWRDLKRHGPDPGERWLDDCVGDLLGPVCIWFGVLVGWLGHP